MGECLLKQKFASGGSGGGLPKGFVQCEYIQSSGTQYIDTNVSGGVNAGYEIRFDAIALINEWQQYFAGDKNPYIPKIFQYLNLYNPISFETPDVRIDINELSIDAKFLSSGSLYVNGASYSFPSGNGWGQLTWYVFNSHSEPTLFSSMRLYSQKMSTEDSYVRNYVPCYCTVDTTGYKGATSVSVSAGTAGLYDLVEKKFYVNCGSGSDFICGEIV